MGLGKMLHRSLTRLLSQRSRFSFNKKFIPLFISFSAVGSASFAFSEAPNNSSSNTTQFLFHTESLPSNFNYGRFVKFIVRDEAQLEMIQKNHSKVIDAELDHFDFCYGFWKDEFGRETSLKSKDAAGLLVPDGEVVDEENEKYKIGIHIQVDFRSDILWFDCRNPDDLENILANAKKPSAAIEDDSQKNVKTIVFDNFLQNILDPERKNGLVILFTTDNCPVCQKAKFLFDLSKRMKPLENIDVGIYSLSQNALPPGVYESSIPGTPHYLFFPPLSSEEIENAQRTIPPRYYDLAARYDGVDRSERAIEAERMSNERVEQALDSEKGVLSDKKVVSQDFASCSDFLMAVKAFDIDPLEAVKYPDVLNQANLSAPVQGFNLPAIVAAFASLFLMAQCSEFQGNRDDAMKRVGTTLQNHEFCEDDAEMVDVLENISKSLDKRMSERIHKAEQEIMNDPSNLLNVLKEARRRLMKQYSIISVLVDRARDEDALKV
eukprot:GDKK01072905.1.p1 GENE.GDKK01072905.1~~GDKK01072905.1.p1  ORF type:complete len:493 (-),score=106.82 GDKK01072905.1:74-1552(-)